GSYHYIQDELQVLTPEAGEIAKSADAKYVGVWTDITERVAAEQKTLEYARQITRTMQDTVNAVIKMLELRDLYTAGHSRRVGELSAAIASELGYDKDSQEGLRIAGLLHDIGKVGVPGEILTKPTRLTDGEFHLVKEHVDFGYQTLKDIDFPWPVADIVHQHHERMNGSGYPAGLRGDDIMMQARIVAVADVIESMASHRPYRPSRGIYMALEEIEHNAGDLYDKQVVAACLKLFREKGYQLPV
ncbi:MAG: HD-GYP domain-containing protein, partial [Gammaproteobacteria bacterium]|nr:HD-GYP domain-containing protein [Gammaproteobacteria bacterium]